MSTRRKGAKSHGAGQDGTRLSANGVPAQGDGSASSSTSKAELVQLAPAFFDFYTVILNGSNSRLIVSDLQPIGTYDGVRWLLHVRHFHFLLKEIIGYSDYGQERYFIRTIAQHQPPYRCVSIVPVDALPCSADSVLLRFGPYLFSDAVYHLAVFTLVPDISQVLLRPKAQT